MDKLLEPIVMHYGDKQITQTIEELSELIKELCKNIKGANNKEQIKEEMADCYVMLEQLKLLFSFDSEDIKNIMLKKLHRTIRQVDQEIQARIKKESN
ncbi:nucleoside triphosphate pyrophosphohydrolase family protein [Spiroplasma chrysopicola]|uniref:NTP pyrophosphohydrolase MazG putative catalytic core domain-containing protein n=1 Tax=Spiroplasma chrysopicola DF-1 TaxID=1276227 RepID=R4UC77_9MOLU|nr:hypothetical protein [Spiroplasma chrysopicola]AGM25504.1 hypothetical protein SCHRY_v1c09310 [Spiroplasma chrysopicola DF-1]